MRSVVAILVTLGVFFQYKVWLGEGSVSDIRQLKQQVAVLQVSNQRSQAYNNALAEQVLDLKRGTDAVENYARQELGLVRDGEVFYQIID